MLNWDGNLIYQLLIKTKAKTILIKYEQCEISPYFRSELIKHPLVVKCSKGVHRLNIRSLYSISNLILFPRIPTNHLYPVGGFHHAPRASASTSSCIGWSLTPGCPFMVITAHKSVFWLDRNRHYSLAFSDIQLCIIPLRLHELGLVLMFFLCLFHQLVISCYLQIRFTHAGFKLPLSMVWNPSCGPFFMDLSCFPPMPVWLCFLFLRTTIHASPCQCFPVCQMVTN